MMTHRGIAAAPGVAIGKVYKFDAEEQNVPQRKISESQVGAEVLRFEEALILTRKQIQEIQRKLADDLGKEHAAIFNAHLLVLEDQSLREEIIRGLKQKLLNVEAVFDEVFQRHLKAFSRTNDEYLRERTADIEDVRKRILHNLLGKATDALTKLDEPVVIIARDLSPSETAQMSKENVLAFVTEVGGRTSHTAIMAKSLEIPAVVGLVGARQRVETGQYIIVDGTHGEVVVDPDPPTIQRYEQAQRKNRELTGKLQHLKDLPAETLDKHRVELMANIELPEEVPAVLSYGAEGIGLFRTEFLYLNRADFPTEEEQYEAYKSVAEQMHPRPVVIRTMDLGGDKFLSPVGLPSEMNPFMGWRAIRFSLARPHIFRIQLRAILRASVHGNLKIMYPLVSGIEEVRRANEILHEVKEELKREGTPVADSIEVGAMMEVPSAALTCDLIAKEVDFFSIGTNDLIQYALAVDRVNEKIAYLYEPTHPAILRLIHQIATVAHENNMWVGMCGEMAGEPEMTLLLLGMGLDELSTSPVQLPLVKRLIRSVKVEDAKRVVKEALKLQTAKEVEAYLISSLREMAPDVVVEE